MTESELRADVRAFDPSLEVIWVGDICGAGNLEAIVQDGWGQYRFPWLKTQREPRAAPAILSPTGQLSLF
jgi:hypothetical protein